MPAQETPGTFHDQVALLLILGMQSNFADSRIVAEQLLVEHDSQPKTISSCLTEFYTTGHEEQFQALAVALVKHGLIRDQTVCIRVIIFLWQHGALSSKESARLLSELPLANSKMLSPEWQHLIHVSQLVAMDADESFMSVDDDSLFDDAMRKAADAKV